MPSDILYILTLITTFVCMVIALWFAIYLLARSRVNQLTFRAVIALLALAFYYNYVFSDMLIANQNTHPIRSLGIMVALVACQDLSHSLLPDNYRKKLDWLSGLVVLLGIAATAFLFIAPKSEPCDPRFSCPASLVYPWIIINLIEVVILSVVLFNLWLTRKSKSQLSSVAYYEALIFGVSTILYGLIGTALGLNMPRFIPNLFMLVALSLLLYSVAHDQTFVTGRITGYDIPVTFLTIVIIVATYIFYAIKMDMAPIRVLLIIVLAIFTHSVYDLVREFLDRLFVKEEHRMRMELRTLTTSASGGSDLNLFLNHGLAILCNNVSASGGCIARWNRLQYEVIASQRSLPVGSTFSMADIFIKDAVQPAGRLAGNIVFMVPSCVQPNHEVVVVMGPRKDNLPYDQEDLYWVEDVAEEIGLIVYTQHDTRQEMGTPLSEQAPTQGSIPVSEIDTGEVLSRLALKPDAHLIECVEDAFRNLNDYDKLGSSPLVGILGITGKDHIEAGKQVQQRINEILDKLRPPGKVPSEPLPHEWHAYTILHDAYVEERLARDIMSRLYISEGTYYRMRRQALRGITRALIETGSTR